MSEAEQCHDAIHGLASGFATAMFVGAANARAVRAQNAANVARCGTAAASARSEVYEMSNALLRERLADAEADVAFLTADRDELERKLRLLAAYVQDLKEGRIAA